MTITIEKLSQGELSREAWDFYVSGRTFSSEQNLVLTRYAVQTRLTKRHKWIGDVWVSRDERNYCSKLPRPTEIPDWVIQEAIKSLQFHICIGWSNADSVIGTRKVGQLV